MIDSALRRVPSLRADYPNGGSTRGPSPAGWANWPLGAAAERVVLVAATWLHDMGYAPSIHTTWFHPLDGAKHLNVTAGPPGSLVAHRSGAPVRDRASRPGTADHIFPVPPGRSVGRVDLRRPIRCAMGPSDEPAEGIHEAISRRVPEPQVTGR